METRIVAARAQQAGISLTRRCELLGVNRSTLYYKAVGVEEDEVYLMNLIRDIWLKRPFYGYRKITKELDVVYGYEINHKRVKRLMRLMGIEALYPKPKTSLKCLKNAVYPYLLDKLVIGKINQVFMVDITYIKLGYGFVYLVALIDVYSRYIVGWEISDTLSTQCCLKALKRALSIAKPQMINSDQGSQFTSDIWIETLSKAGIKISMDGKGRCIDNVYIERFWRTIKYEEIVLNEYTDIHELEKGIKKYIHFYNFERYHQSLNYATPASVYFGSKGDPTTSRDIDKFSLTSSKFSLSLY